MARSPEGHHHWVCNWRIPVATYFRRPEMLEWIGHQLDPSLTPEQTQHAFDALVRRGVLRPMIRGVWELETSEPDLQWWIGAHDSR